MRFGRRATRSQADTLVTLNIKEVKHESTYFFQDFKLNFLVFCCVGPVMNQHHNDSIDAYQANIDNEEVD